MQSTHRNRERRPPQGHVAKALLALMLLATLIWPVATQAQEPAPLPDAEPVAEGALELPLLPPVSARPQLETEEWSDGPALFTEAEPASFEAVAPLAGAAPSFRMLLPVVTRDSYNPYMADRVGFGAGTRRVTSFPQVVDLNAGWYVNWGVSVKPVRPAGIQYMQMVRVRQKLTCAQGTTADRTLCPYKIPHQYEYIPSASTIIAAAQANPGSVWLIGNEMDRVDWVGGGQDEILPELYATAYHDLSLIIKNADPSARLAIGGVIQFTPLREQYLTKIWNSYASQFSANMPVDVWNIHNFIGPEVCMTDTAAAKPERICYGMAIPPGTTPNVKMEKKIRVEYGSYWGEDWKVVDKQTFEDQIRGMRAWMKARGQGDKPLIVSEYGVLWPSLCNKISEDACKAIHGNNYVNLTDPNVVRDFMLWTFDFFGTEKDSALTTHDGGRLVQQWAWYALDDANHGFNPHAALMDYATNRLSIAGAAYANFTRTNYASLQLPNHGLP